MQSADSRCVIFLIGRAAQRGGGTSPGLMQLMGLVLGDGCFRVSLRGGQGRDLGSGRTLLFGERTLVGDARLVLVRRVFIGNEGGGGFLQARRAHSAERSSESSSVVQNGQDGELWLLRVSISFKPALLVPSSDYQSKDIL